MRNKGLVKWLSVFVIGCVVAATAQMVFAVEEKVSEVKKEAPAPAPAPAPAKPAAPAPAPAKPAAPAPAPAKPAIVNTVCPISGKTIDPAKTPDNQTVTYKGQKIGFCSVDCIAAWNKLTDAQKDGKLQAVTKPAPKPAIVNTVCPISGKTIDPAKTPDNQTVAYKGQKIGLCSVDCVAAWNKLTDAQKDEKLQAVAKPAPKPAEKPAEKPAPKPAEK